MFSGVSRLLPTFVASLVFAAGCAAPTDAANEAERENVASTAAAVTGNEGGSFLTPSWAGEQMAGALISHLTGMALDKLFPSEGIDYERIARDMDRIVDEHGTQKMLDETMKQIAGQTKTLADFDLRFRSGGESGAYFYEKADQLATGLNTQVGTFTMDNGAKYLHQERGFAAFMMAAQTRLSIYVWMMELRPESKEGLMKVYKKDLYEYTRIARNANAHFQSKWMGEALRDVGTCYVTGGRYAFHPSVSDASIGIRKHVWADECIEDRQTVATARTKTALADGRKRNVWATSMITKWMVLLEALNEPFPTGVHAISAREDAPLRVWDKEHGQWLTLSNSKRLGAYGDYASAFATCEGAETCTRDTAFGIAGPVATYDPTKFPTNQPRMLAGSITYRCRGKLESAAFVSGDKVELKCAR